MQAEAQCFGLDRLGIGSLQRFSRAERRQEYAEHIRALVLDSWGPRSLAPHIPELRISSDMRCTAYWGVGQKPQTRIKQHGLSDVAQIAQLVAAYLDGVVPKEWQDTVLEPDAKGQPRVNRINYKRGYQILGEREPSCDTLQSWLPLIL